MSAALTLLALAAAPSIAGACVVADGPARAGADLLARRLHERGIDPAPGCPVTLRFETMPALGEGFAIGRHGRTIMVQVGQARSAAYAAGWILGHMQETQLALSGPVHSAPAMAVRGDQIGIRAKNNSFDAWTPAMLARQVEDLALMGANRVQLVAPVSDDAAASPLAPVPARDAILATARAAQALGLQVALYYPLLRDYSKPADVAAERADFAALIADFPALDAVYFPGGDPGHTAPAPLFALLGQLAVPLHARFRQAEMLVSSQGFDAEGFAAFVAQVRARPPWLSAVFVGPQTRATIAQHRALLAGTVPLELYPDTAHAMHAQLPLQRWHPAFALTQGREPVNPRPHAMAAAFADQAPGTRGFVAYSEGVNDDWNLAQWLALAWNPRALPRAIALAHARRFIGDDRFAALPLALEQGWRSDPARNRAIGRTLAATTALRPARWADWRIDLYRYRAVYDALVARRWAAAQAADALARAALAQAPRTGSTRAVAAARRAFARPEAPATLALYHRLEALAARLWDKARMQLSVPRYGASNWERGANLDRAMADLTDRVALAPRMAAALALPTEPARAAALAALADRADRRHGALYDDLGMPGAQPHLLRGAGERADPQGRASSIIGVADHLPADGWPLATLTYAETLYENPLRLSYRLPRGGAWCLRFTWAGEDYWRSMAVRANGQEILPPQNRAANPAYVEVPIPAGLTSRGRLSLAFVARAGAGGGGRGQQVAETWLLRKTRALRCDGQWTGP
ncbi:MULTISPECIES: hypothetical protein [unclassified Novosphingobium]|uniref:hypothetical protein n=1 Tax=unclassified Novosphingobium TaxID=2644732 RepID=UPI00146AB9E7|nr:MULTISPECIES: hypothetical protein [unclassified Novosphingobium]NMN03121.1 hypothetical protein [Novosphingobium sp. SG919]NMN86891.1 hypothetical protein [Novosphingobium sp. SG916]